MKILFIFSILSLFLDTPGFWKQKGEESKRSKSLPHTSTISPTIVITEHSGASSSLDLNFKIKSIETMAESPMPSPPSYSCNIESKMDDTSFESITSRMTNKNSHKASTAKCQKKSVTLPPASLTNEEIQEKSRTPPIQKEIQWQSTLRYAECTSTGSPHFTRFTLYTTFRKITSLLVKFTLYTEKNSVK